MPNPNKWLSDAGLSSQGELPTAAELKVLEHLVEQGNPQLIRTVTRDGKTETSVTNSENSVGWNVRSPNLQKRWFLSKWFKLDKEAMELQEDKFKFRRPPNVESIEIFLISDAGREAIAQFRVHEEIRTLTQKEIGLRLLKWRKKLKVTTT